MDNRKDKILKEIEILEEAFDIVAKYRAVVNGQGVVHGLDHAISMLRLYS